MGKFAENLNLGKRILPPVFLYTAYSALFSYETCFILYDSLSL